MTAAALVLPPSVDWAAWNWMSAQREPVFASEQFTIVDVPWDTDKAKDRRRIAAFLNELAAQHAQRPPTAVILDVAVSPCDTYPEPCGEPMESARRALIAAIRNANAHFDVDAREQPVLLHDDTATGATPHDPDIYAGLTGYGHTQFTALSNGLVYRACYSWNMLDRSGDVDGIAHLWEIVERVRMGSNFNRGACDATDFAVRIAPDPLVPVQAATLELSPQGTSGPGSAFDGKYVIVGTVEDDPGYDAPLRGPQILAWAISNVLEPGTAQNVHAAYDTDPENERLIVTVPAFSAITLTAYIVGGRRARRVCRLRSVAAQLEPYLAAGDADRARHRDDRVPGEPAGVPFALRRAVGHRRSAAGKIRLRRVRVVPTGAHTFHQLGDLGAEASTLDNIGKLQEARKQYAPALESYQQAMTIYGRSVRRDRTSTARNAASIECVRASAAPRHRRRRASPRRRFQLQASRRPGATPRSPLQAPRAEIRAAKLVVDRIR